MNPANSRITIGQSKWPCVRAQVAFFLSTSQGGALRTDVTAWGYYYQSSKSEVSLYGLSWSMWALNILNQPYTRKLLYAFDSKPVYFSLLFSPSTIFCSYALPYLDSKWVDNKAAPITTTTASTSSTSVSVAVTSSRQFCQDGGVLCSGNSTENASKPDKSVKPPENKH